MQKVYSMLSTHSAAGTAVYFWKQVLRGEWSVSTTTLRRARAAAVKK